MMKLIKCDKTYSDKVKELYHRTINHLEKNINYPKWSAEHPSDQSIEAAVAAGEQYVCIENDRAIGAVVLSIDPDGCYEAGDWSVDIKEGEYLVIHALAVDPLFADKGVGTFIVQQCIKIAEQCGYKSLRLDVVPGNTPAEHLYKKMGFVFAGRKDLRRNINDIPVFDLFELNLH